jgi:hypothetical protein
MLIFGPERWAPAEYKLVETPVGQACLSCGELIAEGDSGTITAVVREKGKATTSPQHRECFLRRIVGSVGHQQGTCSCYGGQLEDPPEMTKREAAIAAVKLFERRRHPEEA